MITKPAIITTTTAEEIQKPVVTQTVVTEEEEFSVDLVTDLVLKLQPRIANVVESTVKTFTYNTDEELLAEIMRRLQPEIKSVISQTVSARRENFSSAKVNRLNVRIVKNIKPIVESTIAAVRARNHAKLIQVISEQSFVTDVIGSINFENELGRVLQRSDLDVDRDLLIERLVEELIPTIRRQVTRVLRRRAVYLFGLNSFFASEDYSDLLERILTQARIEVRSYVQEYMALRESDRLESVVTSKTFIDGIVNSLRSDVITRTKQFLRLSPQATEDFIADKISQDMFNAINSAIRRALNERNLSLARTNSAYNNVFNEIVNRVTEIVYEIVQEQRKNDDLIDEIVFVVTPEINNLVGDFVTANPTATDPVVVDHVTENLRATIRELILEKTTSDVDTIMSRIIRDIRPIILTQVRLHRGQFQAQARSRLINLVVTTVTPYISTHATKVVNSDYTTGVTTVSLIPAVTQRLRSDVEKELASLITADSDFYFLTSPESQEVLTNEILGQFRQLILTELQKAVDSFQTTKTTVVTRTSTSTGTKSALQSIFGVSGNNFVKFDTPTYQYGYATD